MTRGRMRRRTEAAMRSAEWVDRSGTDAVAVGMVYELADAIDGLRAGTLDGAMPPDTAGKAAFTAQVLLRYLTEMGLTPAARKAFTTDDAADDLVATLTAIAGGKTD